MQWLPVFRLLERQEIIMTTKVYLGVGSNLNRENALLHKDASAQSSVHQYKALSGRMQ